MERELAQIFGGWELGAEIWIGPTSMETIADAEDDVLATLNIGC